MIVLLLVGCIENNFDGGEMGRIAVTQGDFDDVGAPFDRLEVDHEAYEGIISTATWDDDFDPDANVLKVERLLADGNELSLYDTVFVASGTRGLGAVRYDGLEPDDSLVTDSAVVDGVRNWVARGGTLVVTDWGYDLVEAAWPDAIDFLGDDSALDGAQAGEIDTVTASIEERELREALGADVVSAVFDFSNWAVVEDVGRDTTVWERADVTYRRQDGEGTQSIDDVPVLVSFAPEGAQGGKVVYFAYHIDAQTAGVIDETLRVVVGEFDEQAGEPLDPIE
jgi:hypothetical protein